MDKLEQIKNAITANGMREWTDERVSQAMREYADQQNAELRERVKELESQLAKYSNALKRIVDVFGILEDDWEDCWPAKECSRNTDFPDKFKTIVNSVGKQKIQGKYIW